MSLSEGRIPFEPDRGDVNSDDRPTGAEADAIASGVDPEELGLDESVRPEDAEIEPDPDDVG
jgi:hypothetical protein